MDTNIPKPPETGFDKFKGIKILRTWLDREGGNKKTPQVLDLLAEHTAKAWASDQSTPAVDPDTLRQLYFDKYGGRIPETPASRWLLSTEVRRWWDTRQAQLEQAFRQADFEFIPVLTLLSGGGRGNTTLYRLDVQPLPAADETPEDARSVEAGAAQGELIRYQVEPAKAAWWLRPIIGKAPFRMRSWRGYLLMGMMVAEALAILTLWGFLLLIFRGARPIQASDLGLFLTLLAMTWTWWHFTQPLVRLPIERVTIASDLFLAWSQLNGQFRMTRDAKSKVAGGWFQFVRHWGTCPICAGEVEIAAGGQAFPGRLVGRCSDSPLEHVFSFDPVSLTGAALHTDSSR